MTNFKYIFSVLTVMSFAMLSCSDEIRLRDMQETETEGWLRINVSVSAPEIVKTRGDENSINSIDVLFFEDGELVKKYQTITITISAQGIASVQLPLNSEITNLSDEADIIIIANNNITESSNLEVLEKLTYDEINTENIVMSWRGKKTDISDNKLGSPESPISLVRSVSKIQVSNSAPDFKLKSYELHHPAKEGYVLAAQLENCYILTPKDNPVSSESQESTVYCFPTKAGQSYLLINGEYKGNSSWYKIRLKSKEAELNLDPNHLYDVGIISVKGQGHSSSENSDTWSFNDEEVEYAILDQTGGVLSMISDGYRELGTTRELLIESSGNGITGNTFDVRLACIEEISENSGTNDRCIHYPNFTNTSFTSRSHKEGENYSVEIVEGSGWLELDKIEIVEDKISSGNDNRVSTSGKTFRYSLKLSSAIAGGNMKALIRIVWYGLAREIPVNYNLSFNLSNIVSYDVMVLHDGENVHEIVHNPILHESGVREYHKKIKGEETKYEKVFLTGLWKEDMAGKIRDEGFHFPVMYGNPENPYWAEHQLSLFSYMNSFKDYSYFKVDIKSDKPEIWSEDKLIISTGKEYKIENGFSSSILDEKPVSRGEKQEIISEKSLLLDLKRANYSNGSFTGIKDDYEYSTAQLVITLYKKENDDEGVDFSINLYHTGFFHFVEDEINTKQGTFYYYEVIPMGKDNQGKQIYWLDRNMGSTHALDYVDFGNGTTLGEKGGLYYRVAKNNEGNIEITDEQICPPGYHVPNVTEWNYLMQDPDFVNDQETWENNNYFTTYYRSTEGKIYFPKGRYALPCVANQYFNELIYPDATAGDAGTGYYWTRSITEEGKLQAYKFYEGKASLFDGDIENDWMYLRCVAGTEPSPESVSHINFNVKGATHVYLYSLNNQNQRGKQELFTYPGKEIASAKEVRNLDYNKSVDIENDNSCISFSCSSVLPEKDLYVLFIYKDENGKVALLSSNRTSSLNSAEGWKVKNGGKYYFYWDKNFVEYTAIVPE